MEAKEIKLYTVNEAAQILRVTPRTVYAYLKAGRLLPLRVGQKYLIPQDRLQAFLEAGAVPSTSANIH